jgi:kinesin family protein 1
VSASSGGDVYDPKVPPEMQKVTYKTKDGRLKTVTKAELQEQMEASEKLMQSLNETWEQKMIRTQEVQKEREKALEELGITVEKNLVGVHTPKRVRALSDIVQLAVDIWRQPRCHTWLIWYVFLSPHVQYHP